jgi:hypothetical protein
VLVELGPALDRQRLGHVDLDVADVLAVPDGLEEAVGEAEGEDVVDRFLPEEVIDAEDPILVERRVDRAVQCLRRREVGAERLLDDDPRVGGQTGRAQHLDDGPEGHRRDGQVVDALDVPPDLALGLRHLGEKRLGVVGVGRAEGELAGEGSPGLPGRLDPTELLDRVLGVGAELLVGERVGGRRAADDPVPLGQQVGGGEVEQAREELALGQVAGGAEHDDDVVVGTGHAAGPSGAGGRARRGATRRGAGRPGR